MKRLLALMLCAVSLGVGAQTEYPYPYNPDGNNDGFINLSDLLDLLVLYNTEFSAGVLTTDSTSAIFYTGQMDFWDCASSCVSLTGNWKVLDKDLVGAYKYEISSNTPNDIVWLNTSFRSTGEAVACYTGSWGGTTVDYKELWQCYCQTRTREDIDEINLCEGSEDECGVCNGPGAVYECGCTDIPEGDCDCDGNQLDAIGICGGDCLEDADGDGVCDPVLGPCEGEDFITYHGVDYEIIETADGRCWFAEDLKASSFSSGEDIFMVPSCSQWPKEDGPLDNQYCCYEKTPAAIDPLSFDYVNFCNSGSAYTWSEEYGSGFYYNHAVVDTDLNICPETWHVPSQAEWMNLSASYGSPFEGALALLPATFASENHCDEDEPAPDFDYGTSGMDLNARGYIVDFYGTWRPFGGIGSWWCQPLELGVFDSRGLTVGLGACGYNEQDWMLLPASQDFYGSGRIRCIKDSE